MFRKEVDRYGTTPATDSPSQQSATYSSNSGIIEMFNRLLPSPSVQMKGPRNLAWKVIFLNDADVDLFLFLWDC